MELLSLLFMSSCFLTLSGLTFGDQSGKPVFVREGDYAILPCSLGTNENIEFVRIDWTKEGTEKKVFTYDNGVGYSPALQSRVSYFRDDLKNGSASIRINYVQLKDGGNYTCDFPTRGKTFRIELVVGPILKDRNDPGAAELYVTSHDQINGGALLQCDVKNAYPEPRVEWWNSNNQVIHSEEPQVSKQGDLFNITLKATVKKTGRYRCVATQEEINHQTQKEINVFLNVPEPNTGWKIVAIVLAVVLAVVVGILVSCYIKNKKKRQQEETEPPFEKQKINTDQSEPV